MTPRRCPSRARTPTAPPSLSAGGSGLATRNKCSASASRWLRLPKSPRPIKWRRTTSLDRLSDRVGDLDHRPPMLGRALALHLDLSKPGGALDDDAAALIAAFHESA